MNLFHVMRKINARWLPQYQFMGPSWIVLGVNNHCNLHCRWCDVGTGDTETSFAKNLTGSLQEEMSPEIFRKICDEMTRYYPKARLGLGFTEPLTYNFLAEGLHYAAAKGIRTAVTTNGFALPEAATALCHGACKQLSISLDGPLEIHNRTRGHGQAFQRVMEGLDILFKQERPPEVSIFCLITPFNKGKLLEFAEFLKKYPIKHLGFLHMNFVTAEMAQEHNRCYGQLYPASTSNIAHGGPSEIDTDLLEQEILKLKAISFPFSIGFSPALGHPGNLDLYYNAHQTKIGKLCLDAFSNLMIRTDGSVIPAHGRCFPVELGRMETDNLSQIWNAPEARRFRRELIRAGGLFPACSRCCSAFGG
jgi:sulfatase maturation enzyme AslB (radical SAM superfamily)